MFALFLKRCKLISITSWSFMQNPSACSGHLGTNKLQKEIIHCPYVIWYKHVSDLFTPSNSNFPVCILNSDLVFICIEITLLIQGLKFWYGSITTKICFNAFIFLYWHFRFSHLFITIIYNDLLLDRSSQAPDFSWE